MGAKETILQLDDHLKQLLRDLGHAINDSVSASERVTGAIGEVRAAGFDIVLKLDATIGLGRRRATAGPRITPLDRTFLESLRIRVDDVILEDEPGVSPTEMTSQDIKFLKSLKISLDEES